jgi:hypothetical protein
MIDETAGRHAVKMQHIGSITFAVPFIRVAAMELSISFDVIGKDNATLGCVVTKLLNDLKCGIAVEHQSACHHGKASA